MKNRHDSTNIILSFKYMSDVFAVLLQNVFETTTSFTDAWRLRDFPPRLAVYQVSNKHKVCCCSSRPWTASVFPSFNTLLLLLLILFVNLARLVLVNILCWNSRSDRLKRNPGCWLSPGGATLCYKFDEVRVDTWVRNKTTLKFAKNRRNWFRRLDEAVSSQMQWLRVMATFGPPCRVQTATFCIGSLEVRICSGKMPWHCATT